MRCAEHSRGTGAVDDRLCLATGHIRLCGPCFDSRFDGCGPFAWLKRVGRAACGERRNHEEQYNYWPHSWNHP